MNTNQHFPNPAPRYHGGAHALRIAVKDVATNRRMIDNLKNIFQRQNHRWLPASTVFQSLANQG